MTNNSKTTLAARKQRWLDFYDRTKPARHLFMIYYNEGLGERPLPNPENKQLRIEWAWKKYQCQIEQLEWLDDDSIPYLDIYTGTEIFAEAFGCKVQRPDNTMPFALPLINDASDVRNVRVPDLDTPPLPMLFEIADELRRRVGDHAVLKLVDIQSPMDIAALIWDKNTFYSAMIESPEAVRELSGKVFQFLVNFLDEWFSRYGEDFVAHYPDYYMPKGVTLSEDEVGAVSAEMFVELFLPELQGLSTRYGALGMHCCADARHQWQNFRKIPNLCLLNLVQPSSELRAAYDYFAAYVPQMHSWCGDESPESWPEIYPAPARVVFHTGAETKEKAVAISEKLRFLIDNGHET